MPLWHKARVMLPLVLVNTTGYLLLNHHPTRPPALLPLTPVDAGLPFWVWTIWPYAVLLFADVVLPLFIRARAIFRDTVWAYAVAIALNFTVWALFPTTYPRPPLPQGDSLSEAAYRLLVAVDSPASCFPSGHITIPAVALWGLTREAPHLARPLWGGFALLSLSILTTKQHYAVDLLGGLATAAVGVAVIELVRRQRRAPEPVLPT